jgi:hypothetical protein
MNLSLAGAHRIDVSPAPRESPRAPVLLWSWNGIYNGFVRNRMFDSRGVFVTRTAASVRGLPFMISGVHRHHHVDNNRRYRERFLIAARA